MSLRAKFSVVLALFGLTLAFNVAMSVWSIRFLERELAWPLRSAQPVLSGMHSIKRLGEQEANMLGLDRFTIAQSADGKVPVPDSAALGPQIIAIEEQVLTQLQRMAELEAFRLRSGVSTTENLRDRSREIMLQAQRWSASPNIAHYEQLITQIGMRHELIERIEGRIIDDAQLENDHGRRLRVVIYAIIAITFIGAIFIGVYSKMLLSRWVLKPVEHLKQGAKRFGQGEFDHAIAIQTHDELGQLGEEFNHMASLIVSMQDERVERERLAAMGEMAQRTVHNLRTPLAGIRALAETTQSELQGNDELRDLQARIIGTVDRFEAWLQGMLRVSSPLDLHHRDFDPVVLCRGVIESHRSAAAARSVGLELRILDAPGRCTGDPHHLEHALTALLSNAIDYAPSGSSVELAVGVESAYWTLRVTDLGEGIPSELHDTVFRPYFTTRNEGTGIGLALVKRIIDQHHGSITIESPLKGGSEPGTAFFIRLPCDVASDSSE